MQTEDCCDRHGQWGIVGLVSVMLAVVVAFQFWVTSARLDSRGREQIGGDRTGASIGRRAIRYPAHRTAGRDSHVASSGPAPECAKSLEDLNHDADGEAADVAPAGEPILDGGRAGHARLPAARPQRHA